MRWMVAMFGIVVVPLGIISIYFIVIQPIDIGTWCTLCLSMAAAMLVMSSTADHPSWTTVSSCADRL